MTHRTKKEYGGKGITGWIKPTCSCGWEGSKHYAHNDYQHSNAKEQAYNHLREMIRRGEDA